MKIVAEFLKIEGDSLAIVADGMGGHQAGDIASGMTVDLIKKRWEQYKIETPE